MGFEYALFIYTIPLPANVLIAGWVTICGVQVARFLHGTESEELLNRLTKLGERELVFADPSDSYFGIGFDASEAMRVEREKWGFNVTGQSLKAVVEHVKNPNPPKVETPFDNYNWR